MNDVDWFLVCCDIAILLFIRRAIRYRIQPHRLVLRGFVVLVVFVIISTSLIAMAVVFGGVYYLSVYVTLILLYILAMILLVKMIKATPKSG
jgi:hypothetical protein